MNALNFEAITNEILYLVIKIYESFPFSDGEWKFLNI